MSVKTTGAEWNKFYHDPEFWGAGQWHDDTVIEVDGVETEDYDELNDNTVVVIKSGYVVKTNSDDYKSLERYFKKWKKKQTTVFFVVKCSKEKQTNVLEAIRAAGGKYKN